MTLNIKEIEEEIQDQYLNDNSLRPWIIGFSSGKDSTALLQIVWNAVKKLPLEQRKRDIHIVCNNTLVENPKILEYSEKVLSKIEYEALKQELPISINRTVPSLEDTFWAKLIGKGYPTPNSLFRWCTERLKITPTSKFILEKVNERGEVILLLGTRYDESASRARSVKKIDIQGKRLRKHTTLPSAYVYTPIKNLTTDEIWQYLLQVDSPWNSSNSELMTLYRNANSGDCPLVVDTTTPSCGNSRFGCWVCTVVKRDRSMEALIENGEEWMEPLMEFRDLLADNRSEKDWREEYRRDGVSKGPGPYKPKIRAMFLEKLLQAQKEIQSSQGDIQLISHQELTAIQVLWFRDNIFDYKVSDIYNEVYGFSLEVEAYNQHVLKEKEILKEVCQETPNDFKLINDLLVIQKSKILLINKFGLQNDLENKIEKHIKEFENAYN